MVIAEEKYELNGREIMFRCANEGDAEMLIDYLKTVSGETRFLLCDPDEIHFTNESEIDYIRKRNESDDSLLMLAYVDGEYAGNCSFEPGGDRRRAKHRAEIGIALFQRFAGFGLGRLMLENLLQKIKELGYEQAELTVVSENERAIHLYKSLGFKECGRIPNANKYADGTYADDILMVIKCSEN